MKKTILKGGLLVVLMSMIVACNDTNKLVPDPTPEVDPTSTVEKDSEGVTVLIDYEDVETGETTRVVTGNANYRFTPYGLGGEVQMDGVGRHRVEPLTGKAPIYVSFYAEQNVAFTGWSWRYAEDPKGTHRAQSGTKQQDFDELLRLQTDPGLKMIGAATFNADYQPGAENKVYVKVNYRKSSTALKPFPEMFAFTNVDDIRAKNIHLAGKIDANSSNYESANNLYISLLGQNKSVTPAFEQYKAYLLEVQEKASSLAASAYSTYMAYDNELVRHEDDLDENDWQMEEWREKSDYYYGLYIAVSTSNAMKCVDLWSQTISY